jgi:hypothetical protein
VNRRTAFLSIGAALLVALVASRVNRTPVLEATHAMTMTHLVPGATRQLERRLYDLRGLKEDWLKWRAQSESWKPPPNLTDDPFASNITLFVSGRPESENEEAANAVTQFFGRTIVGPKAEEFNVIVSWAGFVTVEAAPDLHDQFSRLLVIWPKGGLVSIDGAFEGSTGSRMDPCAIGVYDVRDLVERSVMRDRRTAKVPATVPVFAWDQRVDFEQVQDPENEAVAKLLNALVGSVQDKGWPGSIQSNYLAGRLLIRDTIHNHELIANALAALRGKHQ